jgi:CheY-like chemotaxis protein
MALRTLLVDDNAAFIDAARALLERQGIAVVGVASTTAEALQRAEELRPDVILVDIMIGRESGFALARQLAAPDRPGRPRLILISTHAEADFADLIAASPARSTKSELSTPSPEFQRDGSPTCLENEYRENAAMAFRLSAASEMLCTCLGPSLHTRR